MRRSLRNLFTIALAARAQSTGVDGAALLPPSQWHVDAAQYESTATVVAIVRIGGIVQTSGRLGAFAPNGAARGATSSVVRIPVGPYAGNSSFWLMVYGPSAAGNAELLSFRFFDGVGVINIAETLTFSASGVFGSAMAPVFFSATRSSPPPPPPSPVPALPPAHAHHGWVVEAARYELSMMCAPPHTTRFLTHMYLACGSLVWADT